MRLFGRNSDAASFMVDMVCLPPGARRARGMPCLTILGRLLPRASKRQRGDVLPREAEGNSRLQMTKLCLRTLAVMVVLLANAVWAETSEIRIAEQYGVAFLPLMIMRDQK